MLVWGDRSQKVGSISQSGGGPCSVRVDFAFVRSLSRGAKCGFDAETSLYYYRARYYDPVVGRFINEDPIHIKGGINFYRYVTNNATNQIDPSGLWPSGAVVGGFVGGLVGGVIGFGVGGGTLVAPGFGTVGGAVAGSWQGAAAGTAIGAATGALVGYGVDNLSNAANAIANAASNLFKQNAEQCKKNDVICYLNSQYKDPSFDPKFKMCSYTCSDGSVRVRVIHIFLPCPMKWDGN